MVISILFISFMVLSCVYIAGWGGYAGRCFAAAYVLTAVLSALVTPAYMEWRGTHMGVFALDVIYFAVLVGFAIRLRRYWLIWAAGFQLDTVITHFVTLLDAGFIPDVYRGLATVWSLPILIVAFIGVMKDRKARDYGYAGSWRKNSGADSQISS